MKTLNTTTTKLLFGALLAAGLMGVSLPANAAVVQVTSGNFSGTQDVGGDFIDDDATFSELTLSNGTVLDLLTAPTTVTGSSGNYFAGFNVAHPDPTVSGDPAYSDNNNLTGFLFTRGVVNSGANFDFGAAVGDAYIYLLEWGPTDETGTFKVEPLDGGGSVIGDYSLTLNMNNFGDTGADILNNRGFGARDMGGLAFLTSDFSGTTGDLSGTQGIRVTPTTGFLDLVAAGFGVVFIPEPSTLALLFAAAPLFWFCRR